MMFKVRQVFEVREDLKKKSTVEGEGWGSLFGKKNHFLWGKVHFYKISTFLWENFPELEFLFFEL